MRLSSYKGIMSKILIFIALISIIAILCSSCGTNVADAQPSSISLSDNTDVIAVEETVKKLFGDVDIIREEYLYNLDNAPDYIYVLFDGGGYAVFNRHTFEMLEYSPAGQLPYEDSLVKYYAGPVNYLQKDVNGGFKDVATGQVVEIDEQQATALANKIRKSNLNIEDGNGSHSIQIDSSRVGDIKQKEDRVLSQSSTNVPKNDKNNLIIPNGMTGTYIDNAYYFLENPLHGKNIKGGNYGDDNSGTCGPVAAQLLLSYNNYYNDRRIIDNKFLCGYSDESDAVVNFALNPNYCEDPMSMTPYTLGSRSEDTGINSFYSYVVTSIMEPGQYGSYPIAVKTGIENILKSKIGSAFTCFQANWNTNNIVLSAPYHGFIKGELEQGRPVIIQTSSEFGASDHYVVAYGYQGYTYENGDSYTGYVVHYGWSNKNFIWINSMWCNGYISLSVTHEHSYSYVGGEYNEEKCLECGHRRYAFDLSNMTFEEVTISGYEGNWIGDIAIPGTINGRKVNIANALFANQTGITSVSISAGLNSIGANAFEGCTSLRSISLPTALTSIGNAAFYGCSSLTSISIPVGVKEIGANTFQNCTSLATLMFDSNSLLQTIGNSAFQGCTSLLGVTFPEKVYSIGYNAFYGCTGLVQISFKGEAILGVLNAAFANCTSLKSFEMPPQIRLGYDAFNGCTALESVTLSTLITMDDNAFANCPNLTIYTGEHTAGVDKLKQLDCTVVSNCGYSEDFKYIVSINTSQIRYNTANTMSNPTRAGYSFGGWYTTADFSGTGYADIASAPNGTLYAKWNENACVAAGTLITLADGRQVPVESLTGNEMLLVWNLFTGEFDIAPILFIDSEAAGMYEVVTLTFSDGTTLKVIDEHALWDFDLNEYVFMRSDAAKYIGHWFNKQTYDADGNMIYTRVQLTGVTVTTEYTSAWSPVTYGHLCFYVNGMLSMPGATTGLINIFDVDPDTMTIDEEQYLADIAQYGLFTYDEFAALYPVPEEIFDAFGGQYLKVAMGKDILTEEMIRALIVKYSEFF